MSSYPRKYVCVIYEKDRGKLLLRTSRGLNKKIKLIQAEEVKVACIASVSVPFRSKERGESNWPATNGVSKRGGVPLFHFLALVSFLARSKPKIPFLGLSLLRNLTETLATQAKVKEVCLGRSGANLRRFSSQEGGYCPREWDNYP